MRARWQEPSDSLPTGHPVRPLAFVFQTALADIFSPVERGVAKRALAPFFYSFTWVLALGLLAFYALETAQGAVAQYFADHLSQPEVNHIVFKRGHPSGTDQISNQRLVDSTLSQVLSVFADNGLDVQVYGRRFDQLVDVTIGEDCIDNTDSAHRETFEMSVLHYNEPLFNTQTIKGRDGQERRLSELGETKLDYGAIITERFLRRFGFAGSSGLPDGFCLGNSSNYFRILGSVAQIPATDEDVAPSFVISERGFRAMYARNPPISARDREGRFSFPEYDSAALYFDWHDAERVLCAFDQCPNSTEPSLGGFKKNADGIKQIRQTLQTAKGSSVIVLWLTLAYGVAIMLMTLLATTAFIQRHEKIISIMRAFGYGLLHLASMLVSQLIILGCASLAIVCVLLALFEWLGVNWLSTILSLDPDQISFGLDRLVLAAGTLVMVVGFTALFVLALWWRRNRFVGPVLQGM